MLSFKFVSLLALVAAVAAAPTAVEPDTVPSGLSAAFIYVRRRSPAARIRNF